MAFGTNPQLLRRKSGMTQEGLAERMNVSRQTVSKWESDGAFPEMEKLIALCDLFSISLDDLVRQDLCAKQESCTGDGNGLCQACPERGPETSDVSVRGTRALPDTKKIGKRRFHINSGKLDCCLIIFALIIFLYAGIVHNVWHPSWVVFPIALLLCGAANIVWD